MTLHSEEMKPPVQHKQIRNLVMGTWIMEVLKKAQRERRLVSGMYRAAKSLERNSDNIVACVLPQNHLDDAGVHVNSILLEAFCHENDVPVLKVDSEEKLANIVNNNNNVVDDDVQLENGVRTGDFGCVLLLQASNDERLSRSEKFLLQMHKETTDEFVIELPVL